MGSIAKFLRSKWNAIFFKMMNFKLLFLVVLVISFQSAFGGSIKEKSQCRSRGEGLLKSNCEADDGNGGTCACASDQYCCGPCVCINGYGCVAECCDYCKEEKLFNLVKEVISSRTAK